MHRSYLLMQSLINKFTGRSAQRYGDYAIAAGWQRQTTSLATLICWLRMLRALSEIRNLLTWYGASRQTTGRGSGNMCITKVFFGACLACDQEESITCQIGLTAIFSLAWLGYTCAHFNSYLGQMWPAVLSWLSFCRQISQYTASPVRMIVKGLNQRLCSEIKARQILRLYLCFLIGLVCQVDFWADIPGIDWLAYFKGLHIHTACRCLLFILYKI